MLQAGPAQDSCRLTIVHGGLGLFEVWVSSLADSREKSKILLGVEWVQERRGRKELRYVQSIKEN